jgi:hypothetical protein
MLLEYRKIIYLWRKCKEAKKQALPSIESDYLEAKEKKFQVPVKIV